MSINDFSAEVGFPVLLTHFSRPGMPGNSNEGVHVHRGPAHQQRHNEVGYRDAVALSLNVPASLLHVFPLQNRRSPYMDKRSVIRQSFITGASAAVP
jgi:hypothetical protein